MFYDNTVEREEDSFFLDMVDEAFENAGFDSHELEEILEQHPDNYASVLAREAEASRSNRMEVYF